MLQQLTLFAEASPVRTSVTRIAEDVRGWAESGAGFGSRCLGLYESFGRNGLSRRTSPAFYPATADVTSGQSSGAWQNSGMVSPTGCLTLRGSEFPNDADECSLSEVLETDVEPKYYLSPKACRGILRRARERSYRIPASLHYALRSVAGSTVLPE